jgi:hypothetical protein
MARSKDGKYVFQMVGSDQMVMVNDDAGTEVLFSILPIAIADNIGVLSGEPDEALGYKLKNSKDETTYIDPQYAAEFCFWAGYFYASTLDLR